MANFNDLVKPNRLIDRTETVEHEKALMKQFQTKGLRKSKKEQEDRLKTLKGNRYRRPLDNPQSPADDEAE